MKAKMRDKGVTTRGCRPQMQWVFKDVIIIYCFVFEKF